MPERNQRDAERLRLHLLVLRCQAGDEQAFTRLFTWFGERTLRHLRALVGDDAEDAQQEVWLAVYRAIGGLSDPGAFRTWLFQTTRHRAFDLRRRRKRETRLLAESTLALAVTGDAGEGDTDPGPEDFDLVATAAALSPIHREVLLLRYQDELSYAEIALVAGCSIGTVKSRLHQAKQRLQETINGGVPS